MSDSTKSRSVGIITYHYFHNYGAVLQAYALSTVISKMGYRCQIIDFRPEVDTARSFVLPRNPLQLSNALFWLFFWRDHRLYNERFDEFIAKYLPLTEQCYRSALALRENPPHFDTYVCGSDQIWHPLLLNREFGLPFLLDFVPPGSRRVAYAPSFGVSEISEQYKTTIAECLTRFDALSVRESVGQTIVRQLINRPAEHVLDPTLLLQAEDYYRIAIEPKNNKDFVLVYPMELGKDNVFLRLVKIARAQLKLPFVFVFPDGYSNRWLRFADQVRFDAGPREFLGLLKQASFVLTNSFHGTAFSILFGKPFLGAPHSGTNARIRSILELLELEHRQLAYPETIVEKPELLEKIDYSRAHQLLQTEVERSLEYLRNVL